MAETELTVVTIDSLYPTAGTEWAFVAADEPNGNFYLSTGRETLIVYNSSPDTAYDVTITSVPDRLGRTGDIVEEIPFGEYRAFKLGVRGWRDPTTLQVIVTAEDSDVDPGIMFAVIRDPA